MNNISIDIETYSSVDLAECGVYKYAEAPDFEILLFGYSVDGGEAKVVDLASGEKIPDDILWALRDKNVIKSAFNASFERVCLSRFLKMPTGTYLDPSAWRCTMIRVTWVMRVEHNWFLPTDFLQCFVKHLGNTSSIPCGVFLALKKICSVKTPSDLRNNDFRGIFVSNEAGLPA